MENIPENSTTTPPEQKDKPINIFDIKIDNQELALRCILKFLEEAHRRGVFSIKESAKIWECFETFQPKPEDDKVTDKVADKTAEN